MWISPVQSGGEGTAQLPPFILCDSTKGQDKIINITLQKKQVQTASEAHVNSVNPQTGNANIIKVTPQSKDKHHADWFRTYLWLEPLMAERAARLVKYTAVCYLTTVYFTNQAARRQNEQSRNEDERKVKLKPCYSWRRTAI